ncbi:MAG: hypothetical protein ACYCZM_14970 [Acidimicrobiales bacterium]
MRWRAGGRDYGRPYGRDEAAGLSPGYAPGLRHDSALSAAPDLSDASAIALFSGVLAPDDAPPGYQRVAGLIQAAKAPGTADELLDEDYVVSHFAALVDQAGVPSAPKVGRPRILSHLFSPRLAAAATVALLGTGAAGMALTSVPASAHHSSAGHGTSSVTHSGLDRLRHGVGTLAPATTPQSPQTTQATQASGTTTALSLGAVPPPAHSSVGASGTTSGNTSGVASPTTSGTGSSGTSSSGSGGTHTTSPSVPGLPTAPSIPALPAPGVPSVPPVATPPTTVAPTNPASGGSTGSVAKSDKQTTTTSAKVHAAASKKDSQGRDRTGR